MNVLLAAPLYSCLVGTTTSAQEELNEFSTFRAHTLALIGDVDGDGIPDIVAADNTYKQSPGLTQGRYFSLSGVASATLLYEKVGARGSGLGGALARTYDFTGDGFFDFVNQDSSQTLLIDGKTGSVHSRLSIRPPFLSRLGDVDGDGGPELLVGGNGFVGVVNLRTGEHVRFHGGYGSRFGGALAELDDVDGDGVPDYAVGYEADRMHFTGSGQVWVFSGRTGALLYEIKTPIEGRGPDDEIFFGENLGGIGDISGDGVGDLVVAAPRAGPGGAVFFYDGVNGRELGFVRAAVPESYGTAHNDLGRNLATRLGDLNGNGYDDVAAMNEIYGAPVTPSHWWVYDGGTRELLYVLQGYDSIPDGFQTDWTGDGFTDFLLSASMISAIPKGVTVESGPCPVKSDVGIGCSGIPMSGKSYAVHLSGLRPGQRVFLAVGGPGAAGPRSLLRSPTLGCRVDFEVLQLRSLVADQVRPGEGVATTHLQLPADPQLVGTSFLVQGIVPAEGADLPRLTRALRIEVQPRSLGIVTL